MSEPYRAKVVLYPWLSLSNQQALNILRQIRTACTASTASTARAAHFCVPKTYSTPPYTFTRNFLRNTPCWWGLCPYIYVWLMRRAKYFVADRYNIGLSRGLFNLQSISIARLPWRSGAAGLMALWHATYPPDTCHWHSMKGEFA